LHDLLEYQGCELIRIDLILRFRVHNYDSIQLFLQDLIQNQIIHIFNHIIY